MKFYVVPEREGDRHSIRRDGDVFRQLADIIERLVLTDKRVEYQIANPVRCRVRGRARQRIERREFFGKSDGNKFRALPSARERQR